MLDAAGHNFVEGLEWTQWDNKQAVGTGGYTSKISAAEQRQVADVKVVLSAAVSGRFTHYTVSTPGETEIEGDFVGGAQ